ncbi:amino acid adenylation domain-containing protein [Nitrospirillum amazonense]|uniref:Amino acid adenylation domain-containing protein n=1 Tax=Nitrospirillum amazonense TaxID=28077 RepID=A0A560ESQ8_9PROT|nr:non-ribosomal peptide synthetase/type I polyketide synthase [Nitrospirillum amazonense]TWB12404.1 amino acid adenylation domain-containing protein [Nitrospirillum amazonense]
MNAATILGRLHAKGIRLWLENGRLRYEAPHADALTPDLRQAIGNHRGDIIRLLDTLANPEQDGEPTPRAPGTLAPASFTQERFLFLSQLEGPSATYNLTSAFRLRGALLMPALTAAITELMDRHEVLRTAFDLATEPPTQRTVPNGLVIRMVDLTALAPDMQPVEQLVRAAAEQPFDVVNGPHLRLTILQLAPAEHLLVVIMHHIVSDGLSIGIFVDELKALYGAHAGLAVPALAPPALQYADFAAWQRRNLTAERRERKAAFWRQALAGAPDLIQLPLTVPRPAIQTFDGITIKRTLAAATARQLAAQRHDGATAFHVALAAFSLLLLKYAQQPEVVVGVPVANRHQLAAQALIGPFINMIPLRVGVAPSATLGQLVATVRDQVVAALDHADLPFEHIVQAVAPRRAPSHSPLFQTMFVLEDIPVGIMALPGLEIETLVVEDASAKYDLTLVLQHRQGGLVAALKYNRALIAGPVAEAMLRQFAHILDQMLTTPDAPVGQVSALTLDDRTSLDRLARGPVLPYPSHRRLHDFFEDQVDRAPDAVALDFEDQCMTYLQLDQAANRLAHRLARLGVGPETIVGIMAERSLEMVIAVLAVMKAGGAYLPVDPEYPEERQRYMLADANIRVLLAQRRFLSGELPVDHAIALENGAPEDGAATRPACPASPESACYVIYTSGSTGRPKGVVTGHRAISNNLLWMQDQWPLSRDDVVLLKASFSFDVSLKEIMWPLMAGARLVIARPGGQRDPAYLHEVIQRKRVSVVHLVPTMLDYFLQHDQASGETLRIVMCGGEALSIALKERFCRRFNAVLLHLYGPTEAAIAVTGGTYSLDDGQELITLGRPMPNAEIRILSEGLEQVPVGVAGELCIGGTPLARCYLDRPGLTAEKFIPHPFAAPFRPGDTHNRLYRTGDLARWRPDGQIEYLGRLDRQVKFRSFRIELGEIEAALKKQAGVRDAIVTAIKEPDGTPSLVAYIVPADGIRGGEAKSRIRTGLAGALPAHMLPDSFIFINAIPMSPNGKADIDALPQPTGRRDTASGIPPGITAAPTAASGTVALVERTWLDLLDRDRIDHDQNFFEAGGHSLMAARLKRRICDLVGRDIPLTAFFAHPTIASFARFLDTNGAEPTATAPAPDPLQRDGGDGGIAVIGMAGRFPGAPTLEAFWRVIADGQPTIRFFSDDELLAAGVPDGHLRDPTYIRARGALDDSDLFDADYFRFSPRDAAVLDPQVRLLLELAQHVLDDGGQSAEAAAAAGRRIGVFASTSRSSYFLNVLLHQANLMAEVSPQQLSIATDKSFAATHVAYRLDLRGPAMTIDTACSSSLVAIHEACQALLAGEADMMLAGGASVDAPMTSGYFYQDGNIASPDGRCRPFDIDAKGTLKGSGGGLVLLKRLDDALADRDRILAVIKGSAINNDGVGKVSFTAPSETGQRRVLDAALRAAKVPPESIGFIETHGTGTPLGDTIELAALTQVYGQGRPSLGAVKAGIGHLDAAAGVAGFIKTVLTLRAGLIPPLINFKARPTGGGAGDIRTSGAGSDVAGLSFPTTATEWPVAGPRRAAVSSFGIGGTNAHVVLEAAPPQPAAAAPNRVETLLLSAADAEGLANQAARLRERLLGPEPPPLAEVAFTLATGRRHHAVRATCVAATMEDAITELARLTKGGVAGDAAAEQPPVIFLVSGHGGQHERMGRRLYAANPAFRAAVDQALAAFAALDITDLAGAFAEREDDDQPARRLRDHVRTQCLVFIVSFALAEALADQGVRPAALVGLSIGEVTAACIAGAMTLAEAARLVVARSRIVARAEGGMMSVALDEATVRARIDDSCDIAIVNGPAQCVVSGAVATLTALEARWTAEGVRCRRVQVDHAAHSRHLLPWLDELVAEAAEISWRAPAVPVACNVTGQWLDAAHIADPRYWADQLSRTVRLADNLAGALADPKAVLVEIGAGVPLITLARRHPSFGNHTTISLMPGPGEDETEDRRWAAALGDLWARGVPVRWRFADPAYRRTALPGYPFRRRRHWYGAGTGPVPAHGDGGGAAGPSTPGWTSAPLPLTSPEEVPRRWLIAGDHATLAEPLIGAMRQRGLVAYRPTAVAGDDLAGRLAMWPAGGGDGIIYFLPSGDGDATWPLAETLLALSSLPGRTRCCLVTFPVHTILGNEVIDVHAVAAHGYARVALGRDRLVNIDLPPAEADPDRIADELLGLPPVAGQPREVAWRSSRRWLRTEHPLELPRSMSGSGLRRLPPGRTYVLLNGCGPLGLALAETLLEAGLSRLVLVYGSAADTGAATPLRGRGADIVLVPEEEEDAASLAERIRAVAGPVHGAIVNLADPWSQGANPVLDDGWSAPGALGAVDRCDRLMAALTAFGTPLDIALVLWDGAAMKRSPTVGALHDVMAVRLRASPETAGWRMVVTDPYLGGAFKKAVFTPAGARHLLDLAALMRAPEVTLPANLVARGLRQPAPDAPAADLDGDGSPTVARVRGIWAALLGLSPAECDLDFFTLGGDSLAATQLMARIRERFGIKVALASFFQNPTVKGLALLVDAALPPPAAGPAPVEAPLADPAAERELMEL